MYTHILSLLNNFAYPNPIFLMILLVVILYS